MKVCIPVAGDTGLSSAPYGHFGSAPYFVIHDTESGTTEMLSNADQEHAHGACQPLKALDGRAVDAVIVGGIGAGAIMKLNAAGIRVYRSTDGSAADHVVALREGKLKEITPDTGCQHHGGCSH
jgi:predicted Fe-Mo cluster-binding NifX family protein